jgi:hypothetical protein
MKIGSQCLHDGYLGWVSPNDRCNALGRIVVCMEPHWQRGFLERFEMTEDSLSLPSGKILLQTDWSNAGLKTKGVSAEIYTWFR